MESHYTKTDTDALLANKVPNTGNVSLPSHLGVCTTCISSTLRCNAVANGHSGYADINAPSSYDM